MEVSAVDFRQQVCSKQDVPGKKLEGIVGIRKCKIENGKIQIGDDISIGTVGNKIGEVVQTLKYDKKIINSYTIKLSIKVLTNT